MYACGLSYYAEIQGRHDPHGQRKVDDNDDHQEEDAKVEQTLLPTVNPDRNVVVPRWILLLVNVPQLILRPASHSPSALVQTGGRSACFKLHVVIV